MTHGVNDIIKAFSICAHVSTGFGKGCTYCPYYVECRKAISECAVVPLWDDVLKVLKRYAEINSTIENNIKQMPLKEICQKILEGEDIEFSEVDELGACEYSIWSHTCLLGDKVVVEEMCENGDKLDFESGNIADIMQSFIEHGYTHPWYFVRTRK